MRIITVRLLVRIKLSCQHSIDTAPKTGKREHEYKKHGKWRKLFHDHARYFTHDVENYVPIGYFLCYAPPNKHELPENHDRAPRDKKTKKSYPRVKIPMP
jgi:hypothetical protein